MAEKPITLSEIQRSKVEHNGMVCTKCGCQNIKALRVPTNCRHCGARLPAIPREKPRL